MGKTEYLNILYNGLSDFPNDEREEILYKYKEFFEINLSQGKTEDEIISELGDPYKIIKDYKLQRQSEINNYESQKKKTGCFSKFIILIIVLFTLMLLAPISFGLIIIVPFVIIISLFCFSLALGISGIALALNLSIPHLSIPPSMMSLPSSSIILFSIGTLALALLVCVALFYLIKVIIIGIKKTINWIRNI
ncbi:DUF1700 domain-containing protein [Clostridium fallax]|uniref:Uncharacterized membrane protein n=1 Tax=Clostridium fallax TaxID=1533 RepID=A0A1M4VIK9_9CLOT|nr:DUF1700 domain-containing protein [Clostridium fallax]SHE68866.1 Uncharacterized membrane protein [Clostridium fallax]SQB22745.1 membrane protein [Clostridium fallax]